MNKLPPCFAFKNTGKHPRKEEIKKRFNELNKLCDGDFDFVCDAFYGRCENGFMTVDNSVNYFGKDVEITEDDFLAMTEPEDNDLPNLQELIQTTMTEPELTKLPHNFYFQYVDEKDREVLVERFEDEYEFNGKFVGDYYAKIGIQRIREHNKNHFPPDSTEITQQDFIRLTEPEIVTEHLPKPDIPYKGDIKDFPKEVVEWMLDNQVKQGNKRDISVFEESRFANKINGGFNWDLVGDYFCTDVIVSKNFDLFYEKYPKKSTSESTPITGQIIEISERGILISLTKDQIKEMAGRIFEVVTIK